MTTSTSSLVRPNPISASARHVRATSHSSAAIRTVGLPAPTFSDLPFRCAERYPIFVCSCTHAQTFSSLDKTTATESTKVGHVYGLTVTWTSCPSFAEKQKVGGVSGNPLPLPYDSTTGYLQLRLIGQSLTYIKVELLPQVKT